MTVSVVQEFGSWQFSLQHLVEFLTWKVLPRSENMNFGPWNWAVLQVKKFVIYLLYSHRQLTSRDLSVTVFSRLSLDLALTLLVLGNKTRVRLATLVYLHPPQPSPVFSKSIIISMSDEKSLYFSQSSYFFNNCGRTLWKYIFHCKNSLLNFGCQLLLHM